MNKKLLLVGASSDTNHVIEYCKTEGIYTILVDNKLVKKGQKINFDEHWDIDVKDIETLEAKCKVSNVSGIYAGCNELCIDYAKELAEKLNLPFYASNKGWEVSRNKMLFKEYCEKVGLDVPKRYYINNPLNKDKLPKINYPVVVKPIDSSAVRGVNKCENEDELIEAYNEALKFSKSKTIIVEDYIEGPQNVFYYYIFNGKPYLLTNCCDLKGRDKKKIPYFEKASLIGTYNKNINADFLYKNEKKINKLFKMLECKNGPVMLQTIEKSGKHYCIEMGNRLDGGGSWYTTIDAFGFSSINYMVDYLVGNQSKNILDENWATSDDYQSITYILMSKPGKIAKIDDNKIKNINGIHTVLSRFQIGEEVTDVNNLYKMAYYFVIVGKDKKDIINKLDYINNNLIFEDENGNNMLLFFKHYELILENDK